MAGSAAPFLIALVLFASGAAATGDDGAMEIPHLQLPGTPDSGRGDGSDAPPPPQGQLMDIMSTSGCGRFAALVAASPNVSDVFQQRLVPGGGGLTLFCPDDKAVAAFEPKFGTLADSDRLDVLLHHATAARYIRAQLAAFDSVAVRTLATNSSHSITLRDDGDTVWLCAPCQGGAARVIKTVSSSSEGPLVMYIVDAVLLPGHLRQKLDGGDEAAACGGWLYCCIPVWVVLLMVLGSIVGFLGGWVAAEGRFGKMRIKDTQ
ncbi:fasciclin-like arabinogalactan protein 1 [Lolium rigidum]|uniref:fasciclin-like arabinogalactan protein 1 n=1 Tax=Lolium rigidum TaxID=89674 RepID=UPI001F5DB988|nr:fasciclin-like arabinogalactan protein 1 [Lolium rigidum]